MRAPAYFLFLNWINQLRCYWYFANISFYSSQISSKDGEVSKEALRICIKDVNEIDNALSKIKKFCKPEKRKLANCDDGARLYRCIDNQIFRHKAASRESQPNREHQLAPISNFIKRMFHFFWKFVQINKNQLREFVVEIIV